MSVPMIIGLVGLLYILVFGGMSLLRREGLSARFAIEAVIITGIALILNVFLFISIQPIIFVLILYIITMRVRILVDLANTFARRGSYARAEQIYSFASRFGADTTNLLIVKVNQAIMLLQSNHLDESISAFKEILNQANSGYLGIKYEAATHFNLGVAYERKGNPALASVEFNEAIDTWPASLYAHRAQQALNRQHQKNSTPAEDKSAGT